MIDELVVRATRGDRVRNYYDIAVLGYSRGCVESLLPGEGEGFIAVDRLAELMPAPTTVYIEQHDRDGSIINAPITLHEWIAPRAAGSTPMLEALATVHKLVEEWCSNLDNRHSFPPMVFHITDGSCSNTEREVLIEIASHIKLTHTEDGNTLLFNIHLSTDVDAKQHIFPSNRSFKTTDRDRELLFMMSSIVPKHLEDSVAFLLNLKRRGPYRGMMSNYSPGDLISIINTGTESIDSVKHL
jgi:hypothetical protein